MISSRTGMVFTFSRALRSIDDSSPHPPPPRGPCPQYPRLVPLTAPKSSSASDKLYSTNNGRGTTAPAPHGRRPS